MRPYRLPLWIAFLALCISAVPALATTYEYDDLGRLVRETYDNGAEIVYAYDAVGNRTSRTVVVPPPEPPFFADGFESGDTGGWSSAIPAAARVPAAPAVADGAVR